MIPAALPASDVAVKGREIREEGEDEYIGGGGGGGDGEGEGEGRVGEKGGERCQAKAWDFLPHEKR